eukprot:4983399-Pyramimonas_sp.AAC.1
MCPHCATPRVIEGARHCATPHVITGAGHCATGGGDPGGGAPPDYDHPPTVAQGLARMPANATDATHSLPCVPDPLARITPLNGLAAHLTSLR